MRLDETLGHLETGIDHSLPPGRCLTEPRQRLVNGVHELPDRIEGCLLTGLDRLEDLLSSVGLSAIVNSNLLVGRPIALAR